MSHVHGHRGTMIFSEAPATRPTIEPDEVTAPTYASGKRGQRPLSALAGRRALSGSRSTAAVVSHEKAMLPLRPHSSLAPSSATTALPASSSSVTTAATRNRPASATLSRATKLSMARRAAAMAADANADADQAAGREDPALAELTREVWSLCDELHVPQGAVLRHLEATSAGISSNSRQSQVRPDVDQLQNIHHLLIRHRSVTLSLVRRLDARERAFNHMAVESTADTNQQHTLLTSPVKSVTVLHDLDADVAMSFHDWRASRRAIMQSIGATDRSTHHGQNDDGEVFCWRGRQLDVSNTAIHHGAPGRGGPTAASSLNKADPRSHPAARKPSTASSHGAQASVIAASANGTSRKLSLTQLAGFIPSIVLLQSVYRGHRARVAYRYMRWRERAARVLQRFCRKIIAKTRVLLARRKRAAAIAAGGGSGGAVGRLRGLSTAVRPQQHSAGPSLKGSPVAPPLLDSNLPVSAFGLIVCQAVDRSSSVAVVQRYTMAKQALQQVATRYQAKITAHYLQAGARAKISAFLAKNRRLARLARGLCLLQAVIRGHHCRSQLAIEWREARAVRERLEYLATQVIVARDVGIVGSAEVQQGVDGQQAVVMPSSPPPSVSASPVTVAVSSSTSSSSLADRALTADANDEPTTGSAMVSPSASPSSADNNHQPSEKRRHYPHASLESTVAASVPTAIAAPAPYPIWARRIVRAVSHNAAKVFFDDRDVRPPFTAPNPFWAGDLEAAVAIQRVFRGWYVRKNITVPRRRERVQRLAALQCQEMANFQCRVIQAHTRYRLSMLTVRRTVPLHLHRCAREIQRLWRGYWVRRQKRHSVCDLDSVFFHLAPPRSSEELRTAQRTKRAALLVSSWARNVLERRSERRRRDDHAARCIQHQWRTFIIRRRYWLNRALKFERERALKALDADAARHEQEQRQASAIITIQYWCWKKVCDLTMARIDARYQHSLLSERARNDAACIMQRFWRVAAAKRALDRRERQKYAMLRDVVEEERFIHSVVAIQALFRRRVQRFTMALLQKDVIAKKHQAALAIQRAFRGFRVRRQRIFAEIQRTSMYRELLRAREGTSKHKLAWA